MRNKHFPPPELSAHCLWSSAIIIIHDILIGALGRAIISRQVLIFETADVEKCAESLLSLSRTNTAGYFRSLASSQNVKIEIVTVSISDSASSPICGISGIFFQSKFRPAVWTHVQEMIIYDI